MCDCYSVCETCDGLRDGVSDTVNIDYVLPVLPIVIRPRRGNADSLAAGGLFGVEMQPVNDV